MGRDKDNPLSLAQMKNLDKLLTAVNVVREKYARPMRVTSGYRPAAINAAVGGAKKSAHMSCEACDFADPDGRLARWCISNLDILIAAGLYMESPKATPGWVHLQIRPTKNRVFTP